MSRMLLVRSLMSRSLSAEDKYEGSPPCKALPAVPLPKKDEELDVDDAPNPERPPRPPNPSPPNVVEEVWKELSEVRSKSSPILSPDKGWWILAESNLSAAGKKLSLESGAR